LVLEVNHPKSILDLDVGKNILLDRDFLQMQLSMRGKMQKQYFCIAKIMVIGAFVLSACGPAVGNPTTTATPLSVAAISTDAAQTVIAQFTQQAPTTQPTAIFTNTLATSATSTTLQPTSPLTLPTVANCANSIYIADITIPDGTQLPVGQEFTKTWRVQNTGTCPWTTSFQLVFSYGEAMGGQVVALANSVPTGQQVDISVKLKVPNKTGKLTGVWVLVDDKGQHFGALLTVVINVGALSPTPTGSVTATPTRTFTPGVSSTSTSTPTSSATPSITTAPSETPVSTDTSLPTETPTATPTATPG
jgi:hypothetical protein